VVGVGLPARPLTLTPREASRLLADHGLSPSRALGQNFVVDPNTVRRIARLAAVGPGDHVVEVGAGLGSLTLALAESGAAVTAIEVDRHLVPVLREVLAERAPAVRLVEGDATALDWDEVLAGAPRWVLVANLPYNVATPLVLDVLDDVPAVERMLVMVQKEAGERLAAGVGDAAYGIPSVKVAYHGRAQLVGTVGPNVFLPKPRVESVLVSITRHPGGPAVEADPERLFALVRAGFGQRRKMLRRSLAGQVGPEAFDAAAVEPTARAEDLDLAAWARLADASRG
jgi:16S rRNA (adenine1518-N6/adenine1519-N6)-dimethyltransferase